MSAVLKLSSKMHTPGKKQRAGVKNLLIQEAAQWSCKTQMQR